MKKFTSVLCIILALVMILALTACGGGKTTEEDRKPYIATSQPDGTKSDSGSSSSSGSSEMFKSDVTPAPAEAPKDEPLIIRFGENELGRFLAGIAPSEDHSACDVVFDSTFNTNPITKQTYSDIYESWEWIDDYHFKVKMFENIYSSSGNHLTIEDVLFSYTSHEERGSNYLNNTYIVWEGTTTPDDYTLIFEVTQKTERLQRLNLYLLDKKWAESLPDGWSDEAWYYPETSGPYKCEEYVHGDYMRLVKRDTYWKRDMSEYKVDEYIFKAYKDEATMYMDIELGNIDVASISATDYSRYLKTGNGGNPYDVVLLSTGTCYYITYAWLDNPIWKNDEIREAFACGIDLDSLGILVNGDCHMFTHSVCPPDSPYYLDPGEHVYDPDHAKELMQKNGYGPNNKLPLKMTLMDTQVYKSFGQGIAYYLDEMYVDIDIKYADISASIANWIVPGNNDLGMMYSISGSDTMKPNDTIQQAGDRGGVAWTFVDDDEFQVMYDTIRYNWEDEDLVMKTCKEMQQYIFDNNLILPFSCCTAQMAYNTNKLTEAQIRGWLYSSKPWRINEFSLHGWE